MPNCILADLNNGLDHETELPDPYVPNPFPMLTLPQIHLDIAKHIDNKNEPGKYMKYEFLESNGAYIISETNKLFIKRVLICGPTKCADVTHKMIVVNNVTTMDPIDSITFDTGALNDYPGCDVEPGVQKKIIVEYLVHGYSNHPTAHHHHFTQTVSLSCNVDVTPAPCHEPCKPVVVNYSPCPAPDPAPAPAPAPCHAPASCHAPAPCPAPKPIVYNRNVLFPLFGVPRRVQYLY